MALQHENDWDAVVVGADDEEEEELVKNDDGKPRDVLTIMHAVELALREQAAGQRKRQLEVGVAVDTALPEQKRQRATLVRRLELAQTQRGRMDQFLLMRRRRAADQDQVQTVAVTSTVDDQATTRPCTICLDELEPGSERTTSALPCGHVYHRDCIHRWFEYNRCCPIDRQPV